MAGNLQFDKDTALLQALDGQNTEAIKTALHNGADPYLSSLPSHVGPALYRLVHFPSCFSSKADYARPLIQAGPDFDLIRERTAWLGVDKNWFDQRILTIGNMNHRPGDEEFSALVLSHLIAHDLEKDGRYSLPIDNILGGVGRPFKEASGTVGENTRREDAEAIMRNQHALVDYVTTSDDPVAAFLRTCTDYPDADIWMKKIDPVNPDHYSRPTQAIIDSSNDMLGIADDLITHWDHKEMKRLSSIDFEIAKQDLLRQPRSWKPSQGSSKPSEPNPG